MKYIVFVVNNKVLNFKKSRWWFKIIFSFFGLFYLKWNCFVWFVVFFKFVGVLKVWKSVFVFNIVDEIRCIILIIK